MATYYESTNKHSPLSFVYLLLTCLFILPIIAGVYSYAIWYIPIPYINFFITIGFGMAVAFSVSFLVINLGKVRSGKMASLFGIIAGFIALYWAWAIWIDLAINAGEVVGSDSIGVSVSNIRIGEVLSLAANPLGLWSMIDMVNEIGVWGIKGGAVKGTFLTVIWIIEAIIVLFISLVSSGGKSSEPFCEENDKWFDSNRIVGLLNVDTPNLLVQAIEENNIAYFDNMARVADTKKESHSIMTLYANETNENYLTVENNIARRNDKNEMKFDLTSIIKNIKISEEISNMIATSKIDQVEEIKK